MRVLITGAAGFLGSHLCDRFIEEGHAVVGMDNLVTGSPDNIAHLIGHERFRFVDHDVTEFVYVEGELDGVLHLASPATRRTTSSSRSRRSRWGAWAPTRCWGWPRPRTPASCWPPPRRSTATRRSTRSRRATGAT